MFEITTFGNISGEAYNELIKLLVIKSDSFMFHLPNMGKTLINARNAILFPEYPIGYTEETAEEQHIEYLNRMQPFLDVISDDIVEHHKDTGYLDQTYNIEIDVYTVKISEKSKTFFSICDNILSWKYPDFPENLCFISNGVCIFHCIAHEKLCFIYCRDSEILSLLEKNKIDFVIDEH